jgi:hypothetical protein
MQYTSPAHELIECPSRAALLECLELWLTPRVLAALERTERDVGYDVAGDLRGRLAWGRHAPLEELAAVVHWMSWGWMSMDPEFRALMLGSADAAHRWWAVVEGVMKAARSAKRVDWPATPTHPVAARYEPRHCATKTLVFMLHDLFLLWCT